MQMLIAIFTVYFLKNIFKHKIIYKLDVFIFVYLIFFTENIQYILFLLIIL